MSPRKFPPFFLVVSSTKPSFDFPSLNLTLLGHGDSYLRNGVVGLTRDVTVPSSSSGTIIYNGPPESNFTASFSTRSSFSINNVNPSPYGDGLAFFLSKDNQTLGSPGGYLGLVNSSQLTKKRFLAIEFDTKLGLGLGIAGPAFVCAFLVAFGYISVKKCQKMKVVKGLKAELVTGPREFSYKELSAATKGFHSSRIIGRGAFGNVYKAYMISTGTLAAVKRSKHSHEGKAEFLAELSIIACLRHKNLVQLQGWCVEKGEVLLAYEFMPYGSLDRLLYQEPDKGTVLSWSLRQSIAVGLASALTYLHLECEQQVIHRDIKTSNIMLDANFNARLGDFGLARLMEHDKSPVSTLTAGTMGYLAPEYLHCGKATELHFGFLPVRPVSDTLVTRHNVSDTSVTGAGAPPGFPTEDSTSEHNNGPTSHHPHDVCDPSVTGAGAPPGYPTGDSTSEHNEGLVILLVDHSFASRYVTTVILRRLERQLELKFEIDEARDQPELNNLAGQHFDFIVQNISFPNGDEVARDYIEGGGAQVIVIYPAQKARYMGRYRDVGVRWFVSMPVSVGQFLNVFISARQE